MYGNSVSFFLVAFIVDIYFCFFFFHLNIDATAKKNIYPPSVHTKQLKKKTSYKKSVNLMLYWTVHETGLYTHFNQWT